MDLYKMPTLASRFDKLQKITVGLIAEKGVSEYGMVKKDVDDIVAVQAIWTPKQAATKDPMNKNKAATTLRDDYQIIYTAKLVIVYDTFLINNDKIDAADREAMGIHDKSKNKTVIPEPDTAPKVSIVFAILQHIFKMRNALTNRLGRPKGVGFMEVWYKIGGTPPVEFTDANLKINIHKSGQSITFELSQKGEIVYYFARWVSGKGAYGPWTEMFSAGIV